MKTKFSQLLKVKKRKVQTIENEILDTQNQKRKTFLQIEKVLHEISGFKAPKSGEFSQISLSFSCLANLSNQKAFLDEEMVKINKQIEGLKELYKEANIECEKVKYLEDLEIEKRLYELKVQENKDMDEIANLLFAKRKAGAEV